MSPRPGMSMFRQARITPGAMWLLILELGVSLLVLILDDQSQQWFTGLFVASDASVWSEGKVWTLATTMFVEPRFLGILFHGLMLWMFLPALERWWGTRRFLYFAVGSSLVAAIAGTLVGSLMDGTHFISGLDAFIYASIAAYGVVYAKSQVYFFAVLPLTGKQLALGMTGFVALLVLLREDWAHGAAWGAAMLLALVLTNGFRPRLMLLKWRQQRLRRRFKVMSGGNSGKRWIN